MASRQDSDPSRQNSGLEPRSDGARQHIDVLQVAARVVDPATIVWRGSADLPTSEKGVVILGTPLGHADFVQASGSEE